MRAVRISARFAVSLRPVSVIGDRQVFLLAARHLSLNHVAEDVVLRQMLNRSAAQ